jgi:hypothetical protein
MKVHISSLALACTTLVVLADIDTATARPRPGEATGDDRITQMQELPPPVLPPQAPSGYVIVEEDLWSQHQDQPALEFETAQQKFLASEMGGVAESIRRGASYVRAEGSRAKSDDRDALLSVSDALERLSSRVETGKVTSFDDVGSVFARAQRAVAIHHLNLARQAESRGDAGLTGRHLAVAAQNLRQQLTWQNLELDYDLKTNLDEVEKVANQLQAPGAALNAGARQAMTSLEQIITSHALTP